MTCLALRLAGPLQSWGDSSRFTTRGTRREPTKSGVLGLLAAALGRPRDADLADLAQLRFGVRVDQPGSVLRDYHTAQIDGVSKLSQRYYLTDAVFLAVVEGEQELVSSLHEAVDKPEFPLFLGRRSCPASVPVTLGLRRASLVEVLSGERWQASARVQKSQLEQQHISLQVLRDADLGEKGETVRDVPISFRMEHREYGWRDVVRETVTIPNPAYVPPTAESEETDWIAAVGGDDVLV